MARKLNVTKKASGIETICEKVSKISIYLLVFLLPIFFLPWTTNILDFNKQALLIVLVSISFFSWLLKVLISGKINLNLNWTYLPVIVLFLIYLASAIFSSWRYGSFWGWPQVVSESIFSLLGFVLLYFLVINIFGKREIFYLMTLLVFSCFLAVLYGGFQLFGKFLLPLNFTKAASFNTIGGVNSLGILTAVLLPLIIILVTISRKKALKIFFIASAVLSIILLSLINFQTAWLMVIAACVLIILLGVQKRDIFDSRWLFLPMLFLALALFFSFFKFQIPGLASRPVEVFLTHKATFNIVSQAIKENPILGSGPGTFIYNFSKYRDISFNQSPIWSIRFGWGSSKILTLLATTGALGALSFLVLLGFFVFYGIKILFFGDSIGNIKKSEKSGVSGKSEEKEFFWTLSLGIFISFLILSGGFFLYWSNFTLDFIYFLLIASFICLLSSDKSPNFSSRGRGKKEFLLKSSSLGTLGVTFVFIFIFVFGLGVLILEEKRYAAAVNYSKGIEAWQQGENNEALRFLEKAVQINPKVDLYWRNLSQVYLQNMNELVKRTDLSREEINQRIQGVINNTINSAKTATELNPEDVANWSVRGFVYRSLIGVVDGAKDWAVNSYAETMKTEPTNPYFPTQTGIALLREFAFSPQEKVEERKKILSQAYQQFKKAIELKSDYAPARFQLAMLYQTQGKQSEAIEELEKARSFAPNDIGLLFQLGLLYYQNRDYQKARVEFERAVSVNPNYSNALYFLGLTYDQLDEKGKAIEKFKRVSALNPDDEEVKKILENLKAGRKALEEIIKEVPPIAPVDEEPEGLEE